MSHPSVLASIAACCDRATLKQLAQCSKVALSVAHYELGCRFGAFLRHACQTAGPALPPASLLIQAGCLGQNLGQTIYRLHQMYRQYARQIPPLPPTNKVNQFFYQISQLRPWQPDAMLSQGYRHEAEELVRCYVGPVQHVGELPPFASGFGYRISHFIPHASQQRHTLVEEVGTFHQDELHGIGIKWAPVDGTLSVGCFQYGVCQTSKFFMPVAAGNKQVAS